jgi:excisionase family DNA binding protein
MDCRRLHRNASTRKPVLTASPQRAENTIAAYEDHTFALLGSTPSRTSIHKLEVTARMQILLHSKRNAAHLLGISERTLHTMIDTGQLSARRCGTRVLIPQAEIVKFAKCDHRTAAPKAYATDKKCAIVQLERKRRIRRRSDSRDSR